MAATVPRSLPIESSATGLDEDLKNYAALIPSEKAQLKVAEVPFPKCGSNELVIENHAIAINPVDWKIQSAGLNFGLKYPAIVGEDVAGKVLEVGTNLSKSFYVGQRVMGYSLGLNKGSAYGGFQLYPILDAAATSPIPDNMSFIEAAVLPLSISTAAAGLFMKTTLGLDCPEVDSRKSKNDKNLPKLLLWGGSSSVGSSVIQLASAAGYEVITTASSSNFKYCKDLGASQVIDYHDPDAISNLIRSMKARVIAGAFDAIGSETTVLQCANILHALGGGKIASVGSAPDISYSDVSVARMNATSIVSQEPEIAQKIWGDYVPSVLKSGELVPSPKALVVGKGLNSVQKGLDKQKEGVSARKVVITL